MMRILLLVQMLLQGKQLVSYYKTWSNYVHTVYNYYAIHNIINLHCARFYVCLNTAVLGRKKTIKETLEELV